MKEKMIFDIETFAKDGHIIFQHDMDRARFLAELHAYRIPTANNRIVKSKDFTVHCDSINKNVSDCNSLIPTNKTLLLL